MSACHIPQAADAVLSCTRRQWLQQSAATLTVALSPAAWAAISTPSAPAAQRVVSLGGAMTEVIYALGAQEALVATDTTSLYPEAAARLPKVGYFRQLSAEGVLSLKPDAVIGAGEAGPAMVLEQLRAAGVRVELVPTTHNWEEVQNKVQRVGQVLGRQAQAQALLAQLDLQWQATQALVQQYRQHSTRPRALFILAHNGSPMVAGTGTAAHALIEMAGARNVVTAFEGYRPLTAEAMAAVAPQVIVTSTQGIEAMGGIDAFWRRPELALTPAYATRALVVMEASHLLGFGPRLPSAVRTLHSHIVQKVAS